MSLQGSQSRLRVGVSDPPCGCEAKRTSAACLRNQPEGPGPVGQGPNTLHRSLAMELRRQWASPAGCRGQLRLAISGRNGRSGARVDAHRRSPFAGVGRHWTTPRRIPTRPAPSPGGTNDSITDGARRSDGESASPNGVILGLVPRILVLDPRGPTLHPHHAANRDSRDKPENDRAGG